MKYTIAHSMIVTTDDDGSIPLNSRIVADMKAAGLNGGNNNDCQELLHRANCHDDLVAALDAMLDGFNEWNHTTETDAIEAAVVMARVAIAKARTP